MKMRLPRVKQATESCQSLSLLKKQINEALLDIKRPIQVRPESAHVRKKSCCNVAKPVNKEKKSSALEKEVDFHIHKMTDQALAMAKIDFNLKSSLHLEMLETSFYKITQQAPPKKQEVKHLTSRRFSLPDGRKNVDIEFSTRHVEDLTYTENEEPQNHINWEDFGFQREDPGSDLNRNVRMFAVYQLLSLCDQKDSLRIIQRIYKLAEQPDPEAGFPFACTAIYLSTLILGLLKSQDLRVKSALKTAYLTILHDYADDSTLKFHYLKFMNALYYGLWLKYQQQWILHGKNILKFSAISRYLKSFVKEQLNDLVDLADLNSASLSTEHSKSVSGSESGYMKSTVSVMKPLRMRQRLLQTETQQDKTLCTGAKQE